MILGPIQHFDLSHQETCLGVRNTVNFQSLSFLLMLAHNVGGKPSATTPQLCGNALRLAIMLTAPSNAPFPGR